MATPEQEDVAAHETRSRFRTIELSFGCFVREGASYFERAGKNLFVVFDSANDCRASICRPRERWIISSRAMGRGCPRASLSITRHTFRGTDHDVSAKFELDSRRDDAKLRVRCRLENPTCLSPPRSSSRLPDVQSASRRAPVAAPKKRTAVPEDKPDPPATAMMGTRARSTTADARESMRRPQRPRRPGLRRPTRRARAHRRTLPQIARARRATPARPTIATAAIFATRARIGARLPPRAPRVDRQPCLLELLVSCPTTHERGRVAQAAELASAPRAASRLR